MKIQWTSRFSTTQPMAGVTAFTRLWIWFAILCATLFVAPPVGAQDNLPTPPGFSANRILVKPNPGTDLRALHAALGTTVVRSFPRIGNLQIVRLPQNASVTNMLAQFQETGLVQ